jgi:hypothetical protein
MATLISLPTNVKSQIVIAISNIIDVLGKECVIYYPPKLISCTNCTSTGIWKTGGPMPFNFGVCPLCGGQNVKTQEASESVTMSLDWKPQRYFYLFPDLNIRNPKNVILSRGRIADLTKVAQCNHMKVNGIDAYKHFNFKLIGEPIDPHNLAQGEFFLALWERSG